MNMPSKYLSFSIILYRHFTKTSQIVTDSMSNELLTYIIYVQQKCRICEEQNQIQNHDVSIIYEKLTGTFLVRYSILEY